MRRIGWLLLGAALCVPRPVRAQSAADSLAFAGPRGIYVWTGGTAVSTEHPVDGIVARRIERRRVGESTWVQVADVAAVPTAETFFSLLAEDTRSQVRDILEQPDDASVWAFIAANPTVDALAGILADDRIRLALGFYGLDADVRSGERYEYRIRDVDASGTLSNERVTTPVGFPSEVTFAPIVGLGGQARDSVAVSYWHLERGHTGRFLEVWRREGLAGEYQMIDSIGALILVGDSLRARYEDHAVRPEGTYQYFLVPRDLFFNRGPASDTTTLYASDAAALTAPTALRVESVDTVGLVVRWSFRERERIRAFRVERAPALEGPWTHVGEVPPGDSSWTDVSAEPGRAHYYRLRVVGPRGEIGPPTATTFGLSRTLTPPTAPYGVRATGREGGGVEIVWFRSAETDLRGYVVARASGGIEAAAEVPALTTVSDVLGPDDTVFVDSVSVFDAGRAYTYLVRAISVSEVPGEWGLSDPVVGRAVGPPGAPTALDAWVDGDSVELGWNAPVPRMPGVRYRVYRRVAAVRDTTWVDVTGDTLALNANRFRDRGLDPGRLYEYSVRAEWLGAGAGPYALPLRVEVPRALPVPPGNLRASRGGDGIVLEWDPVDGPPAVVRVHRSAGAGRSEVVGEVPLEALTWTDARARAGVRYFYFVTVVRGDVEGPASAAVSGRR
ncbi:MAG: fibronectin type III domain-containing protein [Gemmatimonadota bacterium]